MSASSNQALVNSWTEWGQLEEVVIGRADHSSFPQKEPNFVPKIHDKYPDAQNPWPTGRKSKESIDKANKELDNFQKVLEGEGIKVRRPDPIDHFVTTKAPGWSTTAQYGTTCPRDIMITIGNIVLEAPMSQRCRFFEYLAYRTITQDLWKLDKNMLWKATPKPSMDDNMYNPGFWDKPEKEVWDNRFKYEYAVKETEPVFDAADIVRIGKDIFVQRSCVTNDAGIEWLRRELNGKVRVHPIHFPDDIYAFHIDASFVPLRPPKDGEGGLILLNPDRLPLQSEMKLWLNNGWKFIVAPQPVIKEKSPYCQCSSWLSMNILSLSEKKIVIEENDVPLENLLHEYGFDVIKIPFRNVYEFGGSLHCATWDIRRQDSCVDYFPNFEVGDVGDVTKHLDSSHLLNLAKK